MNRGNGDGLYATRVRIGMKTDGVLGTLTVRLIMLFVG